jgi:hypothetical protein
MARNGDDDVNISGRLTGAIDHSGTNGVMLPPSHVTCRPLAKPARIFIPISEAILLAEKTPGD